MNQGIYARHRKGNLLQAAVIMTALFAILLVLAWLFAGIPGIFMICIIAIPALAIGGTRAPAMVLKMYSATPLTRNQAPALAELVEELAGRAGLRALPFLYYIPSRAALAFSVGLGRNGAIAISDGMLRLLTRRELVGVIAHEICHIAGHDTRVMGVADLAGRLASAISFAGQILIIVNLPVYLSGGHSLPWLPLLLMAVSPHLMTLLQLALSRSREYEADLAAVSITGDAEGLAAALERIEQNERRMFRRLFVPTGGIEVPSVLRTHPANAERISRLLELADRAPGGEKPQFILARDQNGQPVVVEVDPPRRPARRRIGGYWY
jgi:heat shock protein HtpX